MHLRDGTISRIDGKSGEVVAENDGDIAVGGGSVWVTTRILPVIQIDPGSNRRVAAHKAALGLATIHFGFRAYAVKMTNK